ncbi:SusC/RagA family TonB-linked outer membrane protein [Pedobacter helvus]|uniref:SusC/RagA family TonB-linked outer membrane protein n=1 Tax=Pedobacter helvus TaxID=2563444 RepID=A0ABW9JMX4_9SPHI|nr:TonB-dependent receptor [Pedobacter ureilyticus]
MKISKQTFLLVVFMALMQCISAQTNITGKVVDKQKGPLIGVSIKNLKNRLTTISNQQGNFTIRSTAPTDTLEFTYLGFKVLRQVVGTKVQMEVTLQEDSRILDEVIVVAYGEVKQKDLTGSVSTLNMNDINKAPVARFDDALGGRIAGVSVTSTEGMPGSDQHIVIRGTNSVTQSNTPLYVIDGFPTEESVSNSLSPADIESITVLKDASATAIYGARAANGVVVITTKKGKIGTPVINYDGMYGVANVTKEIPLLNAYEFVRLQQEILTPADFTSRYLSGSQKTLEDYRNVPTVNWQDLIFVAAPMQTHNISLSGGTQQTRYNVSFSAYDQDGIIRNSNYTRYQGRAFLDQKITNKLRFNVNLNYAKYLQTGESPSQIQLSNSANLIRNVWSYRPLASLNDFDILDELIDESIATASDLRINPLFAVNEEYRKRTTDQFRINGNLEYEILKGLKLRVAGGLSNNSLVNDIFNNSKTRSGNPFRNEGVNAAITNSSDMTWLNENTLTYNSYFDKAKQHSFDLLLGQTIQGSNARSNYQRIINIPNEDLGMAGIGLGTVQQLTNNLAEWRLNSFISRFNYKYKSKYYFTATLRADGSSKFPKDNRWGYFPSMAAAWNIAEEPFLKRFGFISSAKLRASWGITGNNRISEYSFWTNVKALRNAEGGIAATAYVFDNNIYQGSIVTSPGNTGLKWETTAQTDIGLDLSLFKQKLNVALDLYRKNTSDLLLNANLPPSFGFSTALMNIGRVQNEGLEITIDNTNVSNKDFNWTTAFNISFNRNKVLELARNEESLVSIISYSNSYIARLGQPMGMLYGYVYEGTYKYDDFDLMPNGSYVLKANMPDNGTVRTGIRPGDIRFRDMNGDGKINDDDATVIGSGIPQHYGGLTNRFQYKDFDLNIFFSWKYGNDILFADKSTFLRAKNEVNNNRFAGYANRWTPQKPASDIPRVGGWGAGDNSTFEIEDGSFLRLSTVQLGYNLPASLTKRLSLKKARVYVSGQNLWIWTNYSGYDPEVSTKNTALTPGYDSSAYPKSRLYSLGLNISF